MIAECGVNFSSIEEAKSMIGLAKQAGANFVKFQLFNEDTIKDSPHFEALKALILTEEQVKELQAIAQNRRIGFILTPMYMDAVPVAAKYADLVKIRFKDRENLEMIDAVYNAGRELLISAAGRPLDPSLNYNPHMHWLYCIPSYPPQPEEMTLEIAASMQGFSSHFPHFICDMAYVLTRNWADVYIEKHVMMDDIEITERETISEKHQIYGFTGQTRPDPIDKAVSVTFPALAQFIKDVAVAERIRRLRLL